MAEVLPHPGTKIGKHSVWLYGGVLAGIVIIYMYYSRSRSGATTTTSAPDTVTMDGSLAGDTGTPNLGSGTALPVSSGGAGPSGSVDATGGTDTTGDSVDPLSGDFAAVPDNYSWEADSVKYLISHGVSGINAQRALEKYMAGQALTYQEATWLNGAIAANGIAPDGVQNTPSYSPKPKPHISKPKPHPVVHHKPPKPEPVKHHPAHTTTHHPAQTKHTTTHKQEKAKPKPKPKVTIRRTR